jgi:UDP-N-acetylglucosamine 4,6-dehydratase
MLGEVGKPVMQGFAYDSGANPHFLSIEEIQEFNRVAGI